MTLTNFAPSSSPVYRHQAQFDIPRLSLGSLTASPASSSPSSAWDAAASPRSDDACSSTGSEHSHASSEPTPRLKTFWEWRVERTNDGKLVHAKREVKAFTALPVEKELQKQSLYRTELCQYYEKNGKCPFGDRCLFAHGVENLRAVLRHPKYKTKVCKQFHETGHCQYGVRCRFIHDVDADHMPGKQVDKRDTVPSPRGSRGGKRNKHHVPQQQQQQRSQHLAPPSPQHSMIPSGYAAKPETPRPLEWTQAEPLLVSELSNLTPQFQAQRSRLQVFRSITAGAQ